jgi:hypothetical protein
MKSSVQLAGPVKFAENTGERIYMLPFTQKAGLPVTARRWQRTVDQMLDGIEAGGPIYLMVDQGFVQSGDMLRRPGVHIDGNWIEELRCHRGDGGGGGHRPPPPPLPGHRMFAASELLIMASDVLGCQAYLGDYDFMPKDDGDCSHIDVTSMDKLLFEPNRCYVGTVTTLHEAIPQSFSAYRTIVRLNVPQ